MVALGSGIKSSTTAARHYKISNDVLILILRYLDPTSLWRACKAFKRVHSLVMEYSPLHYAFELALAGMRDGPASHVYRPAVGRLQLLSAYRIDWPSLVWGHEHKMLLAPHTRSGVSSGFLHQIRVHNGHHSLDLAELPSCRTSRSPALTRHLKFRTPEIENVALDRTQALIVTSHVLSLQNGIGVVLYFRDLWTFEKHPKAYGGTYDFNVGPVPISGISITIAGHNMSISFEFSSGKIMHLVLNWRNFQAGWLEDNDIQFISENRLLVVRRNRGLPYLSLYNISNISSVVVERDYELPEAWARSTIGFSPNTSPLIDEPSPSEAMFYPDPSKRVILVVVKTPSPNGGASARNWLIVNESFFRPTSRKDRLRVSWNEWGQSCLIRDAHSAILGPYVNGSRIVFAENAPRHSSSRAPVMSRLNVIEFSPFPDSNCVQSHAWSMVGPRCVLVPNEGSRELPPKTADGRQIEDIRLTEDNVVLFLSNHDDSRPVNILTFGVPPPPGRSHSHHDGPTHH
ncbi:hypothetical protein H0H93_003547 [Arthromyces matolae]|nr:hypothetical protein H0H93_003547 [Arthromyces matolae]